MEVPLPAAVENLLQEICRVNETYPADAAARKRLAEAGVEASEKVLTKTLNLSTYVYNLSGLIVSLLKKSSLSPPRTPPPPASPLSGTSVSPQAVTSSEKKRKRGSESPEEVTTLRRVLPTASPTSIIRKFSLPTDSVIDELEQLDFRKTFLILCYIGRSNLEAVVSPDKIWSYRHLTILEFERQIWSDFGRDNCMERDRINVLNWADGGRYNYHCHVDAVGSCTFKGPFLDKSGTLLQRTVGDENVLIVKFIEEEAEGTEAKSLKHCPAFNKVFEEGIFVGRKCYRFFVFKDGGREEKKKDPTSSSVKCYFVCTEGFASLLKKPPQLLKSMSIQDARSIFMHIHRAPSLSNYMARFSLILSKTVTLDLNFDEVRVEVTPDVPCRSGDGKETYAKDGKALIHTDGTGFISEDLALLCPHNCFNGYVNSAETFQVPADAFQLLHNFERFTDVKALPSEPPLLIQFRMFHKGRAIKGTVLVNKELPPKTIVVRDSMLKVQTDPAFSDSPTKDSFEIVTTSTKPKVASLSKNLIALLHYGDVPEEFFLALVREALKEPLAVLYRTKAAMKVAVTWDFDGEFIAAKMIASGIPLEEPFIQTRLSEIAKEEMKSLKAGKLPVSGSFYVMGTTDPTETLNSGEVCVILDQGQYSGPVLVYRNPGIHPGDIHVVKARYIESLTDIVGNSKYGIFFPSKGPRSMADEIAGGDYDGDMYWVSMNPELLMYFKPSKPWTPMSPSPKVISKKPCLPAAAALECHLFRLYVATRLNPSMAMGIAADSWLAHMDRVLTLKDDGTDEKAAVMKKIYELIDIYYDALDAPKKGVTVEVPRRLRPDLFPHHMGKGERPTYTSSSVLGKIYDMVDRFSFPIKFWKLKCFEAEIPETHVLLWNNSYAEYRAEMRSALQSKNASAAVYQKYREKLYGGVDNLDMSVKPWPEIRLEALAIYHVSYDYAEHLGDLKKCGFAWKVAGDALCKIYLQSTGEKPISFAPSVVRQIF